MEDKIVARIYKSETSSVLQEDGYWKVVATTKDSAKYEGKEEWVEEVLEAMSIDTDYKKALETVTTSILSYIVDNIHNKGFTGLIEYREFERNFKKRKAEKNGDKAEDIQDT